MKILIATSNRHKLDEIHEVFAECARASGVNVPPLACLSDLPAPIPEPIEDQDTFEGNALLKARYYAARTGLTCLADDSGLEVDALDGRPGVLSARYAGVTGPRDVVDPANNRLLLQRLRGVPIEARSARFVCAMALVDPGDDRPPIAVLRGTVGGRMLDETEAADVEHPERGRGANGFGYDPLFLVKELGRTTAELTAEQKNAISHRGHAARMIWRHVLELV